MFDKIGIESVGRVRKHRLYTVGGPACNWFFISQDLFENFLLDWCWGSAVLTQTIVLDLVGHDFVALAGQNIHDRLSADNLAGRRYQGWISEILPHFRYFLEDLGKTVECALHLEL